MRDGEHVYAADGFVAIADIDPQAPVHLLVLPEHHVDTFRDVGAFARCDHRTVGRSEEPGHAQRCRDRHHECASAGS